MLEPVVANEQEMMAAGAALAPLLGAGDVVALRGTLGTGKTTWMRGLLRALGLQGEAPSPTFAIVQPYGPPEIAFPVAHVDLYRLENETDISELGLDDYLLDGALVIEWPERMGARLWPAALVIDMVMLSDGRRRLTATVPPSWKNRWPAT